MDDNVEHYHVNTQPLAVEEAIVPLGIVTIESVKFKGCKAKERHSIVNQKAEVFAVDFTRFVFHMWSIKI